MSPEKKHGVGGRMDGLPFIIQADQPLLADGKGITGWSGALGARDGQQPGNPCT
jgi:hypothetical protein